MQHTKCGEIHYQKSRWYILCVFCRVDVTTYDDFRNHFESHHFKEFVDMLIGPLDIPLMEDESLTSINSNRVVSKADDPLTIHCGKRGLIDKPSGNKITVKDENGQAQILNVVTRDSFNVQLKDPQVINCMPETSVKGNKAIDSRTCDEICIDIGNNSGSESSNINGKTKDYLRRHPKKRSCKARKKNFTCTYCGRTFRRRLQIDTHLNIHTGAKPHQCEICGRQFRAITTLQRHLGTHEQRNYLCNYCSKSFTHKAALLSHETRHTQERREPCDLCEKRFYTVNQLDTHKRRVHKKSHAVLPFACDLCPNRYRTSSTLSTHKCKKHYKTAKFQCGKCEKKFIDMEALEEHQKIHVDSNITNNDVSSSKS